MNVFLQDDLQSSAKQHTLIPAQIVLYQASEAFESSKYGWFDYISREAYCIPTSMNTCLPYNVVYRAQALEAPFLDVRMMTVLDLHVVRNGVLYLTWPRHAMAFGP